MLGTSKSVWGFDPRSIPGCSLWLDAADTTTVVQSSGSISQWNDKSASALTATAVNNPTIVANVQNGLPGVSLNGSNQYFNLGNNLNMLTNQLYIFIVSKFNSTADGAIIGKSLQGGGVGRYSLLRVGGTLNPLVQGTGGGNDSGVNSDTNTSARILNMIWDRNTIVLYQNGSSVFSVGLSEPSSVTNSYSLLIGAYQNGSGGTPPAGGLYMNGFIHEILLYFTPTSSPLTTSQRQQIEGYLAHKWGLTASYSQTVPLSIPGCQLWLDGADPAATGTPPANGAIVSTWVDKSGNGRNGSQVSNPTYDLSRKALYFSGSQYYTLPDSTLPSGNSSYTYFMIVNFTSYGTGYPYPGVLGGGGFSGSDSIGFRTNGAGGGFYAYWFGNDIYSTTSYDINKIVSIVSFYNSSTTSRSLIQDFTTTTTGGGSRNQAPTNNTVGKAYGSEYMIGYIHEVIVYNTALTTTQRQTIEGYLAKKWGIGSSSMIPSTHPFSKIPPYLRVFQPNDIPGCQLWLDAADLSSLTLSGSNLTAIRDKSGVTTPTVTPGFLYASNSLNGHGVIYNNNGHIRGTFPTPFTSSIHTTFIVAVADSLPSDGTRLMSFRAPGGLPIRPLDYAFGSFRYLVRNPNTTGQQVTAFTNRYFIWTCYNSSSNLGLRLNGATDLTTNITTNPTTITGYGFGWNDEGDTQINFPGKIAESLVFNTALTTAQIQQIEWYLANKWGIFSTSPVSTPLTIPGCGIWLDGADTSSMTFSSGAITQWRDKSGSSNHFGLTRGTATSILDNGRNVVNFGEATVMTSTNSISFTTSSAFFIVSKMTSTNGAQDLLGFPSFGNGFALRFFSSILYSGNSDDLSLGNYYVNGNFNPSYPSTTYYNTYSLISTLVPSRGGTTVISLSDNWLLEGHAQRFFIGNIAEFIFYPGGVTNIQRQKIEGYLANKWGLTLPAPTVHPYDKYPPASLHTVVIPTSVRLINLGSGSGGPTSGSFTMNSIVGGGTGTFTNSDVFSSDGAWGMAQCFDGGRSDYDLYMTQNPNFMELVFPRELMVTKIFLVPRNQQDAFPSSLTLKANGTLVGTYTSTTVSQALGMGISYSGTGFYIQPATKGTTWRFDFTTTPVSFGEIEFWGYLPS